MKLCGAVICALCISLCLNIVSTDASAQAWLAVLDQSQHWFCDGYKDQYDVYVWVYPDTAGVVCAEYQFILPEYMLALSTEINPAYSSVDGTLEGPPGVTICFQDCQIGPVWTVKHHCAIITGYCSPFEIIGHEVSGEIRATTCSEPDSYRGALTYWYHPSPCSTCPGTEETSWGAIKQLYK